MSFPRKRESRLDSDRAADDNNYMQLTSLTFITGNKAKAEQVGKYLHFPIEHLKLDLPEIQSLDLHEIIEYKAKAAFEVVKKPILIEDVSLTFASLNKLPGTLVKWFLQEIGNEGLCRLLDSYEDRSAVADITVGFYDGKKLEMFDGTTKGNISDKPRGTKGFGWCPIFIPDGYTKTWGEIDMDEQKEISMRWIALKKLEAFLKK